MAGEGKRMSSFTVTVGGRKTEKGRGGRPGDAEMVANLVQLYLLSFLRLHLHLTFLWS